MPTVFAPKLPAPVARSAFKDLLALAHEAGEGPCLVLDTATVRDQVWQFRQCLPNVEPHFAFKANPHREIARVLQEEGVFFEIASLGELQELLALGEHPANIFFSNPIKTPAAIKSAYAAGVQWFAIDGLDELYKVFAHAPTAKMYLRIEVDNTGSDWPLSGKFGATFGECLNIIDHAAMIGADLCGVTFHVGSQCHNPQNWRGGIESAKTLFAIMEKRGLTPRLLNIGGGFPVYLTTPVPALEEIAAVINDALLDFPWPVKLIAEPGRYLVAESGVMVCHVTGTATRAGKRWVYLDIGVFGGLMEACQGIAYTLLTEKTGAAVPTTLAGPTCDSMDVLWRDIPMPSDLKVGDAIVIHGAGAYTTAYASRFNGFELPAVIVL
jgi:ornithine decarboxylase